MIRVAPRCRSLAIRRTSPPTYVLPMLSVPANAKSCLDGDIRLLPFEITCVSIVASFIATIFTAPLNALKLHAIDKNTNSIAELFASVRFQQLYRGYWSAVLKFAPRHAIEHTLYNQLHHMIHPSLAGAISTVASVTVAHPLDSLHIRNVLCRDIKCVRALFNGALPAVAQAALNGVMWYNILGTTHQLSSNRFVQCGITALVCNIALHPFDVLKTTCSTKSIDALAAITYLRSKQCNIFAGIGVVAITSVPCQTIAYGSYVCMRDMYASHKQKTQISG